MKENAVPEITPKEAFIALFDALLKKHENIYDILRSMRNRNNHHFNHNLEMLRKINKKEINALIHHYGDEDTVLAVIGAPAPLGFSNIKQSIGKIRRGSPNTEWGEVNAVAISRGMTRTEIDDQLKPQFDRMAVAQQVVPVIEDTPPKEEDIPPKEKESPILAEPMSDSLHGFLKHLRDKCHYTGIRIELWDKNPTVKQRHVANEKIALSAHVNIAIVGDIMCEGGPQKSHRLEDMKAILKALCATEKEMAHGCALFEERIPPRKRGKREEGEGVGGRS